MCHVVEERSVDIDSAILMSGSVSANRHKLPRARCSRVLVSVQRKPFVSVGRFSKSQCHAFWTLLILVCACARLKSKR